MSTDAARELSALLKTSSPSADLIDTPELLLGIRSFPPHADFFAHTHASFDEVFIGIAGELTVWVDEERHLLRPSDVIVCDRQHTHYVVNESSETATIAVLKSPNTAGDTHPVEWTP